MIRLIVNDTSESVRAALEQIAAQAQCVIDDVLAENERLSARVDELEGILEQAEKIAERMAQ